MTNSSRPIGRFFSVLISIVVMLVSAKAAFAGGAVPEPPPASPAAVRLPRFVTSTLWERKKALSTLAAMGMGGGTSGPALTQISDIVYRADGTPAQGTITLQWPGFTTSAGQAVVAGELSVNLGPGGTFSASVAPNAGSSPATYYKVVYHLNDGTTSTEYWAIPVAQSTTISAVRSKLVPTNVAAQFLTRDVADASYVHASGAQTVTGALTFASAPTVPSPQNATDAANKAYVDGAAGTNLSSPPPIGSTKPNTVAATTLSAQSASVAGALNAGSIASTGRISAPAAAGNFDIAGDLTLRSMPGVEYMVSKYGGLQAAINAAYNNGTVLGMVVDDRTAPYSGPGFILYDSVTLKLAPTTYTITSTVSYNNGNNTVTSGIISVPGSRLLGASTSTNHGTVLVAGNNLNADLIATSTVGTGIAAAAQWWHWGGLEDLRIQGNGANQAAGNCINVENMGETAFLRSIEVSGCKVDNIVFTGASATPSDILNITTNSAGRYGINFNNLAGMAVIHGLSGDSNTTSLIRLNGGQSGTLTIVGLKTEEELGGQDPLITIDQTGQSTSQPGLYVVGGYTFGRTGVNDIVKIVNGATGTTPFINFSNFYTQNYTNAVNDTVNGRTVPAASMSKVPFYYGPTGGFLSGQAYTLDLNTFVQGAHSGNGLLTEIFGNTSSNETLVAAAGNSTSLSTGGIGFRMPNRTTFGATPELMAKMTFAFPGGAVNNQQWEFIPTKVNGDLSTRWIGDASYRWDEVYASDVNTTTATIGTLSVTNCSGCTAPPGTHLLNYQTNTATLVGNASDQTIYSFTLPAATLTPGTGVHCYLKAQRVSGSGGIAYKWRFGATTAAYGSLSSASASISTDMEVFDNPGSTTAQILNLSELHMGNAINAGALYNFAATENSSNPINISVTFNGAATEQIRGVTFKCMAEQ